MLLVEYSPPPLRPVRPPELNPNLDWLSLESFFMREEATRLSIGSETPPLTLSNLVSS